METKNLPIEELKKFGIINDDNTFTKKLSPDDIQRFLQGYTIVADNDKKRATFQLVENNSRLNVIFLERDKSISEILQNSKDRIAYTDVWDHSENREGILSQKKAFVFDKETDKIVEFDFIRHTTELTAIIADLRDAGETHRYKIELQKLQSFLQDKIDQFPELAKEISHDLNIVSKEIGTIDGILTEQQDSQKQDKTDIRLGVNDPDLYQDANRVREEKEEQEREEKRGFRR